MPQPHVKISDARDADGRILFTLAPLVSVKVTLLCRFDHYLIIGKCLQRFSKEHPSLA
jgi:hypothetical protein